MSELNKTEVVVTYQDCTFFNFVLWGIVGSSFCILGMLGNTLAFTGFQRDRRTPAVTLLQCLACSDFVLLLAVFVTDDIPYACDYSPTCENFWMVWPYIRYVWLVTPLSHMCSIWFVVLIAMNRYWAVCKPHNMNRTWTLQRTICYVIGVIFMVFAFNTPRFFEYKIVSYLDTDNTTWISHEDRTDFGRNYYYKVVYKAYLVNVLLVLVPLLTLIFLTFPILKAMHARRNKDKGKSNSKNSLSRASHEITFVLSLVLVVAIVCQTPLAIFHFVRNSYRYHCGDFVFYLDNISKLLVTVNSSINFVIYCLFSSRFRRLLWATINCLGGGYLSQIEPYSSTRTREYSMSYLRG